MENWSTDKWNEYDWEREIRRDERRIGCYFDLLRGCIDLPGEQDDIYSRIMARPDLIPSGVSVRNWSNENMFGSEESDDFNFVELHQRDTAGFLTGIERCAVLWNRIYALEMPDELAAEGLKIVCGFGKLISRLAGMLECRVNSNNATLELSLYKRVLGDLGELYEMLADFTQKAPGNTVKMAVSEILTKLLELRESFIDELLKLRNSENGNGK